MLIDSRLPLNVTVNHQQYLLDWQNDQYILRRLTDKKSDGDGDGGGDGDGDGDGDGGGGGDGDGDGGGGGGGDGDGDGGGGGGGGDDNSELSSDSIIKFQYQIPDYLSSHIRDFFNETKLPVPAYSTYFQCHLNNTFIPDNSLTILVGYAEKYRKYLYPLIFHLDSGLYYLTGQPIYYNYNQVHSIETESHDIPVLTIRYNFDNPNENQNQNEISNNESVGERGSWPSEESYNLIRIFTLNPPTVLYQIIT